MTTTTTTGTNASQAGNDRTDPVWDAVWAAVPAAWRTGIYRLDQAPGNEVFVRNAAYLRSKKTYDFKPTTSTRMGQELAWWVYTSWAEGTRKIDPAMLRWWQRAIDGLATSRTTFTSRPASVADFLPGLVVREALHQFRSRHNRLPSPGNVRNLESVAHGIHSLLTARCTTEPWWAADTWDLALDNRIPRREHEPAADRPVNLTNIEPTWLRDGVRFWLSRGLTTNRYTWTSVGTRAYRMSTYFSRYLVANGITHPTVIAPDDTDAALRAVFSDLLGWMRSPAASSTTKPLAATAVASTQSTIQTFYEFMYDHAAEAVEFTGNHDWAALTAAHTRLWAPEDRIRRDRKGRELGHITTADVTRMLTYLDILSTSTDTTVTIDPPGGTPFTTRGLGDPQAARAWLLQALTGRRASEILMLDHDPITRLPDIDTTDDTAFVARLRYQQTKVDDVDPTILVEQAVVNVIAEQQDWVRTQHPDAATPRYLFLNPRGNFKALRPRSYTSYQDALRRLDSVVALLDADGRPLRFTQTHRLRHTRATELLNAGVPIHVVQRYLGHKSPEMTMRYAATLAATAEAEFLRYKKVGADGRDLNIAPRDLLDLAQLDQRADRILPNGLCLLPPTQTCDKGNACLPCGSFATDATHLSDHQAQRDRIAALIDVRQAQFTAKHGTPMPEGNIWLTGRQRELASLDAIINRLNQPDTTTAAVQGPGTQNTTVIPLQLVADSSHAERLHQHVANRAAGPTDGDTHD